MKKKRQRFAENETFPHVFQPRATFPHVEHELKGRWSEKFFQNNNPIVLELGCGRGEYTVHLAELYPEKNFIGIDWKGARLWRGAKTSHVNQMKNVAFLRILIQNIQHYFDQNEVSEIWITFPDPQPRQSRERKRLTSPRFLTMYEAILKPGSMIHLKTDNKVLYDYSLETAQTRRYNIITATDDLYAFDLPDPVLNIQTTYENIFLKQGLKICYLKASPPAPLQGRGEKEYNVVEATHEEGK